MKIATRDGLKSVESTAVDRPDIQKGADALLEAIKQWNKRTEGRDMTSEELLAEATEAVKRRLP